jgi:hypothetical protein
MENKTRKCGALSLRLAAMDMKRSLQEFTAASLPAKFGVDSVGQAKSEAA